MLQKTAVLEHAQSKRFANLVDALQTRSV